LFFCAAAGTIMPLADYAKFYEMLLNNGVGPATVSKNGLFEPFVY
jgi:hypothetical protein